METGRSIALQATIDERSVKAFARFSGDRSSLHVDPEYGKRSRYNSNVVHGMLPLMLLPAALDRLYTGRSTRITRIQGQFLLPILPGDKVTIRCMEEDNDARVRFEVVKTSNGTIATRGSMLITGDGVNGSGTPEQPAMALVADDLQEQEFQFETLEKGHRTELPFRWDTGHLRAWHELLGMIPCDAGADRPEAQSHGDPAPFALLALLSTQVGMVMPGRTATFQEFTLEIDSQTAIPHGAGMLSSTLAFRSPATHTITQDLTFRIGDRPIAYGKVSVRVARSPFVPPTMEELAHAHEAAGLQDKVVLITGGSRGLGATTAKLFALHGARVAINYRASREQAEAVAGEINAFGGRAMAVQADVTLAEEVRDMVERITAEWGTIDVLVNNAAGNFHPTPFLETRWEKVQEDIDVIVKGAFLVTQAVLPFFIEKGDGRIINVSSIAVDYPPPLQAKYVIAKSAITGLTRALAVEYADRGIRVNMVVPSMVETDFTSGYDQVAVGRMKAGSPMKRLASPQDVAEAIVFLASSRSGYTTGQKLMVTGGMAPFL